MHKMERSIVINRPVDEVFAYTMDPRNNADWNGWVVDTTFTSDGPVTVGTRFSSTVKFLGKTMHSEAEITELVPNQRGSIRTTTGPITATGSRIVEPVEGGTKFTQTIEADFSGVFGGIAESIVVRSALRQGETDLQTLKDLLESGAAITAERSETIRA
jgi:uncharacterized protein YndB with AHSA1/START domain